MDPSDSEIPVRKPGPLYRNRVKISRDQLFKTDVLDPKKQLPLAITPGTESLDRIKFAEAHRNYLREQLSRYGAVLFRNFDIRDAGAFEQLSRAICGAPLEYRERSSPRTEVGQNIYTSTDYPADQSIFLHNENSYQHRFPLKILFYCASPASRGGETPIADVRKVLAAIRPEIRNRFAEMGVMYVRNFGNGMGLSWQSVFQTSDTEAVENYCRQAGIQVEWRDHGRLRTKQVRPAIAKHPQTGELVWFNHAAFFHVSTLPAPVRQALLSEYGEEDLPNQSYYGDGSSIETSTMDELREAYARHTMTFPWQRGDVLLLDNMLVAHGRSPFEGPRRILVSMAEPWSREDVL